MAQTDRTDPVFFFDQPTRSSRIKGARCYILNYREAQLEAPTQSHPKEGQENESQDSDRQKLSDEPREDDKFDSSLCTSAASNLCDPMDAYKRAAPQLLDELARLLTQHEWSEKRCIPCGIVNILNDSWDDLTAGASLRLQSPTQTEKRPKQPKGPLSLEQTAPLQASDDAETGRENPCVGGDDGSSERKPHLRSPVKKCKLDSSGAAHSSTRSRFSLSASSCTDPGGLILPEQPPSDGHQSVWLCQWVVERLQAAQNPEKLQISKHDLSKPLIRRHYDDAKVKRIKKRRNLRPQTLVTAVTQTPELKPQDPVQQKLHYGLNDGSSCVYYPSGCMAVCQSHSGLPCGGFYTNVFSDGQHPSILATITASGHGAVTHPLSSVITAVWDQDGGFTCDEHGNRTKAWSWQTRRATRNKIIVKVSDQISVTLFSEISASLSFTCENQSVHLPLSFLSNRRTSEEMTEQQLSSDSARDVQQPKKEKSPAGEKKINLRQTPVNQVFREQEEQVELPAQWRRRGHTSWELKKLQQRIRNTVEDWLDCYRVAIGIRCPDTERMPAALLMTRPRREAALPSLNPPEPTEAKPEESRRDDTKCHRDLSAPAERSPDLLIQTPRTSKRRSKPPPVIRVGPLQIHGFIDPESVTLLNSPDSDTSLVDCRPVNIGSFPPSVPLTVCPALLRAALQEEVQQRRCYCSSTLMPVVTDLEYDALILGQPPHSHQILVVCVTQPHQLVHTESRRCALEELYRRRNKHRTMPCTQCQMDSFRLVRYEMLPAKFSFGSKSFLLQQRHNAAPGMVLMYIRGNLLSGGYISSDDSCTVWDLQRQISKSRRDYRLGVSLPSDYKFSSDDLKNPAATQTAGDDLKLIVSEEEKE